MSNKHEKDCPFNSEEELFQYAEQLGVNKILIKIDPETQLTAVIALHKANRGPGLGGCRFVHYSSVRKAMWDAIRLAHGMAYKSAMTNLPHSGAKGVIIKPRTPFDRKLLMQSFGRMVDDVSGRYLTAVDSGTTSADMDTIASQTRHVLCTGSGGDPSPYTAIGVRRSIEAALKYLNGSENMNNLHVALQGLGNVGYLLARDLHQRGAKLTVCDIDAKALERARQEFDATVVEPDQIYQVPCDIFSPCALGAGLNETTIPLIRTKIIAGAANNQLARKEHGKLLLEKEILYAPDYITNAGGLIFAAALYANTTEKEVLSRIDNIYHNLIKVFQRAKEQHEPTSKIADQMAEEILSQSPST